MNRMLSGGRPTGKLHLGHYMGAFKSLAELQQKYETFFIISDMHMLTTKCSKEHIKSMYENTINMVIDSIGMGVSPDNTTYYLQSQIPELSNIYGLIQNMTTVDRISQTPSLKEMAKHAKQEEMSLGLLAYPVLEAADIFGMNAKYVPVGKDNIDHIKITQEIIRFINSEYGAEFDIPEYITTKNNYVLGIDGSNKMSKSLDNCIYVRDTKDTIADKVNKMQWANLGDIKLNVVLHYLEIFGNMEDKVFIRRFNDGDAQLEKSCRNLLKDRLISIIEPMHVRMKPFLNDRSAVSELLQKGTSKAKEIVQQRQKTLFSTMGMIDLYKHDR